MAGPVDRSSSRPVTSFQRDFKASRSRGSEKGTGISQAERGALLADFMRMGAGDRSASIAWLKGRTPPPTKLINVMDALVRGDAQKARQKQDAFTSAAVRNLRS